MAMESTVLSQALRIEELKEARTMQGLYPTENLPSSVKGELKKTVNKAMFSRN